MTASGVSGTSSFDRQAGAAPAGPFAFVTLVTAALAGAMLVASAVVEAFAGSGSRPDFAVLAVGAVLCLGYATWQRRRPISSRSLQPVSTLSAVVIGYLLLVAISSVIYLATGTFGRIDDALYESVAGVSTSSLTLLERPDDLSSGLLIWRAGTQWLGGLGALALAIAVLPFLGGSRELADPRRPRQEGRALAPRPGPAFRRVAVLYSCVSVAVLVALALAGMSIRDAIAHTLSSVSTGGFSTHSAGIDYFGSRAIDLVMIVVMAGAGSSLVLVWMIWRGQFRDTRKVPELKVYFGVLVASTVWITWLTRNDAAVSDGLGDRAVEVAFTVVSLSSTTGHHVVNWGALQPGAVMLLVCLMVIGGMAGSVAGGLRWIRVVGLVQFVWRELQRQLHPRSVRSVKVGATSLSEGTVDRMHAQLVILLVGASLGAMAIGFLGGGIVESFSLAFSALSTTGPAVTGEGTLLVHAADLSAWQRAVLMPMMIAGRVFLYPALVLAGAFWFGAARTARDRVVQRHERKQTAAR